MHPITLLTKTTAKSCMFTQSFGGTVEFTTSDAAASLSGLHGYAVTLAYWRFCGDDSQRNKMLVGLVKLSGLIARKNSLKLRPKTLVALAEAALVQYERPICTTCNGGRYVQKPGSDKTLCKDCNGIGRKMLNKSDIGKICKLNRRAIQGNHINLVNDLYNQMVTWEGQVIRHVREKID